MGSAILSVILLLMLVVIVYIASRLIWVAPQFVATNDQKTMMMFDPFARAKDLLSLLFPLFAAVVSFWFGTTVEGRRADQNKAMADEAEGAMHNMQGTMMTASAMAADAKVSAMLVQDAMQHHQMPAADHVDALIRKLDETRKMLAGEKP